MKNQPEISPKNIHIRPPEAGKCQECGGDHPSEEPHDIDSLYYMMKFYQKNARFPTWDDACAHCTPEARKAAEDARKKRKNNERYNKAPEA